MNNSNSNIPNELYYLDEDFPVRSLRKYQLKEILSAHNIPYLHNITKSDLVNLFKKHIMTRREEILKEYRAKELEGQKVQYGRGHRASHKPVKFADGEMIEPLVSRRRRQKSTAEEEKTTKEPLNNQNNSSQASPSTKYEHPLIKDKDGFAIPAPPSRPKKITPSFNPEDSFGEEESSTFVAPRYLNKVLKKPSKKEPSHSVPVSKAPEHEEVAFSITNNFDYKNNSNNDRKGGSHFNPEDSFASSADEGTHDLKSRARVQKKTTKDLPRKVSFADEIETREEIESSDEADEREEEEEEEDEDYHADEDSSADEDDEDMEEIDEDELVSLYRDQTIPTNKLFKSAEYPIVTRSRTLSAAKRKALLWKARLKHIGCIALTVLAFFSLIGYSITTYARQKNGYCTNTSDYSPNQTVFPSPFSFLPSPCIPCPDHGFCSDGDLTCDVMYQKRTPFYNIGHFLPIADECIHNSVLGKHVATVERKIKKILALRQGEFTCEYPDMVDRTENAKPIIARIPVKEVLADLKAGVQNQIPDDTFQEVLVLALAAALEDPKIHYWELEEENYLGTEHAKYTTMCKIKRAYDRTSFKAKMYIILSISILSGLYSAIRDYKKTKAYNQKIDELVKNVLDELKKQYDNHRSDPTKVDNPAVPVTELRSTIVDVNRRETIKDWQRIVEEFESHPHVRRSFHEVRGDPVEFWEFTT
ncbi:MAG: Man1-Src1p-C-terminal domain-containing protein [Benjaminiella poitrasii]|nr:MAG: Man1-Src1p-C-terminal domain-containing protein [Benjaminiella poitrasii]